MSCMRLDKVTVYKAIGGQPFCGCGDEARAFRVYLGVMVRGVAWRGVAIATLAVILRSFCRLFAILIQTEDKKAGLVVGVAAGVDGMEGGEEGG